MIPLALTVADIEEVLFDSDNLITKVELIDFFDKEDWADQRSVAFRLWVNNPEKTLEKEEIESVRENAFNSAEKLGAKLR
jgi:phenylalanyl-tRNA synthetase beta subunit